MSYQDETIQNVVDGSTLPDGGVPVQIDAETPHAWNPANRRAAVFDEDEVRRTIRALIWQCNAIATEKGWWDPDPDGHVRSKFESTCLVMMEASEAAEEARFPAPRPAEHIEGFFAFDEELSDILIRVFDLSARFGSDLENALLAKIKYNRTRPYRHGDKLA